MRQAPSGITRPRAAVIAALCGAVILASLSGCGEKERVLARVGKSEITDKHLAAAMRRARPDGAPTELEGPSLKDLKESLLAELIEEELIVGAAAELKISVSDDELKAGINALKRDYDEKTLNETVLKQYDSMAAWEEDVRKKLLMRKVMETVSGALGDATDDEAAAYYKEHIAEYRKPERVRAKMILVSTRADAEKAAKRLKTEKFDDVAASVSQSPGGPPGGNGNFFARGEMPREFEDAVFSLEPGKLSDVVETPYGFHIFLVEEKKAGSKLTLDDVRGGIKSRIKQERADREFRKWMLELKGKTKVELLEAP